MQLKQKIKKKRNRRVAMILEINFNFIQSHQLSKSQLQIVTQQVFSLSFKKRLTITVRRVERIVTFANEANLIVATSLRKKRSWKWKCLWIKSTILRMFWISNIHIIKNTSLMKNLSLLILRFFSYSIDISSLMWLLMKNQTVIYSVMKNDTSSWFEMKRLSENVKMKEKKEILNEKNENWTNLNEENETNENENDEKEKNEKTSKK